jgi:hypothetical protein
MRDKRSYKQFFINHSLLKSRPLRKFAGSCSRPSKNNGHEKGACERNYEFENSSQKIVEKEKYKIDN